MSEQIIPVFRSDENFFFKEKNGIKNNTVRFRENDKRFELLDKFHKDEIKELDIKIVLATSKLIFARSFVRKVKDVSIYENLYIITWYM